MSYNANREKRRLEMSRVGNAVKSARRKPLCPDVPDEFRRFARCLVETEPPLDDILKSGQTGPDRLDRVYRDMERILDVVGGFEKKRAELEKEIKLKEDANRTKAENHDDEKVILTDHIGLMTSSQEDFRSFKKVLKEPHQSPSKPLHPHREDLFESAQKGVYLPADAFVQPKVRHFEDLRPTFPHPMMYYDLRHGPLHGTWGISHLRDRYSSPYAFRRRRAHKRDRHAPEQPPPAEELNKAAHMAALDMPFDDLTNHPSRQIVLNLRGILQNEIRALYRNRRMGPSVSSSSVTRTVMTGRGRGRPRESDRGDASTHLGNHRRQNIIAEMVQITPMKENLQPRTRKTKLPHTKNLSQPQPRKDSLMQQNRLSQNNLAAKSLRTIRSQTINKAPLDESGVSMSSIDEPSESLLVIQESDAAIGSTDEESAVDVIEQKTRRLIEVNSLEDSLSVLKFKHLSNTNPGAESVRKHSDAGDTPKNVPDSTNQPEQSTSHSVTSCLNSDHTSHSQFGVRRLCSLQRSVEKLEQEYLRATTLESCKKAALEQLQRDWKRLSTHFENMENRQGDADGDLGESFISYSEDRMILLLQKRELEERCKYNERKLIKALRDATEAKKKSAALENEISLLRQQQEEQLQSWEERFEEALRENRLLAGAIGRMSETE